MLRVVLVTLATALLAMVAHAADWPERPVKLLVPSTPGSSPDTFARILADGLQQRLGQPIVVENRPGAGGAIAVQAVARAAADGYTVAVSVPGPLAVNTLLYKSLPYDPQKDVGLVSIAVTQPNVLVVRSSLNVNSVNALVALLKASPGKYTYAAIGVGSITHLCMELIAMNSGSQLTQIPYPGSSQALMALVSGEVDMGCLPAGVVDAQAKAGKLKALAVATAQRSTLLPEVPTLKESGVPGIEASAWMGLVVPANTPAAVVKRLRDETAYVLNLPETKQKLAAQYMEMVASTPEQFAVTVREEIARWKPVVESRHIQID